MAKTGGRLTVMGVVFIILGVLAIVEPVVAGLAVTVLVGWLLIAGGLAHLVQAFSAGGIGRALWQIVLGVLYAIGGFYFLTHPLLALGTLTLMLAGILFAEAILWLIAYFQVRRPGGFAWLLLNAIVTLLLAGMIWRQWPSSSVWAIGTLVGVNLLMAGFSRLMIGSALRGIEAAGHA